MGIPIYSDPLEQKIFGTVAAILLVATYVIFAITARSGKKKRSGGRITGPHSVSSVTSSADEEPKLGDKSAPNA
jgi:hypothetical protein